MVIARGGLNKMAKYRKKPVIVEARQLSMKKHNWLEIKDWCNGILSIDGSLQVPTTKGYIHVYDGWWVIKNLKDIFYTEEVHVCTPNEFERTYEKIARGGSDKRRSQK